MKINNHFQLSDPTLYYKLDPGEPGIAAPTPASRSIAKVATHEATNIRRFRREAIEDGGYVISSYIFLNLQYRGSYLAAVSGKSKALVVVPEKDHKDGENKDIYDTTNDNKDTINPADPGKNQNEQINLDKDKSNPGNKQNEFSNISDNEEITKINNSISKLEDEKLQIKSRLNNTTDNNLINKVNIDEDKNINKDKNLIEENKLKEVEKKIKYLEIKIDLEKQKEYLKNLVNYKNFSMKLVSQIYNNVNSGILVNDLA